MPKAILAGMDAPKYQAPPTDPAITALADKAQQDDISAIKNTDQIDTANIMARYGARLAQAGMPPGSPLAVIPPPAPYTKTP